jgi:hypothetical protein
MGTVYSVIISDKKDRSRLQVLQTIYFFAKKNFIQKEELVEITAKDPSFGTL